MCVNAAVDVGKFENLGVYPENKSDNPQKYKMDFFKQFCRVVAESNEGKGAIGFEAPLFVPAYSIGEIGVIRTGTDDSKRHCDIDRRRCVWHSPVGAGVTIRGIVLLKLLFDQIAKTKAIKNTRIFTDYFEFMEASSGILIYEAFVNGKGNPLKKIPEPFIAQNNHDQDAALSAFLFSRVQCEKEQIKTIFTDAYINLPAVLASSAGLEVGLRKSGFIIRAFKPEKGLYDGADGAIDYFNVKWE